MSVPPTRMLPPILHAVHQVVHAIEAAEQRGLAAAGRPDVRGDPVLGHRHRDVLERDASCPYHSESPFDLDHRRLHDAAPWAHSRPELGARHLHRSRPCACPPSRRPVSLLHGRQSRTRRRRRLRMPIANKFSSTTISEQEQRGREHHRPRRVDVGRLEADVVDVKAEMHELPVEVEERPVPSTGSDGASLTTPVIMSGATSPAARAMARISPVRIDGITAGSTTRSVVSSLVAERASDASRMPARNRGQPLLGRHDDDRHRQERERQRGPEDAARPVGRRRQRLRVEEPVDRRRPRSR